MSARLRSAESNVTNGAGVALPGAGAHRFWGFSPALDLLAEAADAHADAKTPRRFLLLSPGDARHILRTLGALARRRSAAEQADAPALEFSVYEQAPELLARHLLLFSVALDFELPRRGRRAAPVLLANPLLREDVVVPGARAAALRRVYRERRAARPLIDLSLLKMKDRDRLHDVLCMYEDLPGRHGAAAGRAAARAARTGMTCGATCSIGTTPCTWYPPPRSCTSS